MEIVFGNIQKPSFRDFKVHVRCSLEFSAISDLAFKSYVMCYVNDENDCPPEEYEVYVSDIDYYHRHFPQIDKKFIKEILGHIFIKEEYYYIDLGSVKGYVRIEIEEEYEDS